MKLFDLDDGEKIEFVEPSREDAKRERQKDHNDRQKRFARAVGENFATIGLFAIMALMIGSIWTEVGITSNWSRFLGEALTTIILYILADIYSSTLGVQGGKLDDDYILHHKEYLGLREKVRAAGTILMEIFCDWQIDVEYESYLRRRCRELKIDYKEYVEKYQGKSLEELAALFPLEKDEVSGFGKNVAKTYRNAKISSKAAKIFSLSQIKPIELTPDILMTDGRVRRKRGGVSKGGEEYVDENTTGWKNILITALWAIFAAIPVINLIREFSVGMLIYTIFKICLMLYRMYSGYSRGAKGYNSIEPKHLQDKIKYLYLYLEFLDKKVYKTLGDRYTVTGDDDDQVSGQVPVDEAGAGGHS